MPFLIFYKYKLNVQFFLLCTLQKQNHVCDCFCKLNFFHFVYKDVGCISRLATVAATVFARRLSHGYGYDGRVGYHAALIHRLGTDWFQYWRNEGRVRTLQRCLYILGLPFNGIALAAILKVLEILLQCSLLEFNIRFLWKHVLCSIFK